MQGILSSKVPERDETVSRKLFPAIDEKQCQKLLARLEVAITVAERGGQARRWRR